MIKHVEIINKQHRTLRGYLDLPKDALNLVVMFHGYTGNKTEHNGYFRLMSRELAKLNIASLRMDYSCNGESDGEFGDFSYLEAIEDAHLMLDYAASIPQIKKLSVLGFSMGGAIAALVCNYRPIDKLLLWSPAGDMYEKLKARYEEAPKMENGNVYSPAFELSEKFVNSMANIDPFRECAQFSQPVLVIHGRKDEAVNYLTGLMYATHFPNARIHLVSGAGHGYAERESKNELITNSLNFFSN